MHDIANLC